MMELAGFGSLLSGIWLLYWAIAVGAVLFAIHIGKGTKVKVILPAIAVAFFGFLPAKEIIAQYQRDTYSKEAWAYFKKLCDEKSGEKIFKKHAGVKSVLVVKPLLSASDKDHYDQFWYGDPYSYPALEDRGETRAASFLGDRVLFDKQSKGFEFVEMLEFNSDKRAIVRLTFVAGGTRRNYGKTVIDAPESRFGISWEDISTPEDRKFWVAGSRLRIVDLLDNSVVAERVGYLIETGFGSTAGQRRPWLTSRGPNTTCPSLLNGSEEDRLFILKVLSPEIERHDGK